MKLIQNVELIIMGLAMPSRFDNDGGLVGYVMEDAVPDHQELLANKNFLIKKIFWTQEEFEVILFNYCENNEIISIEEAKGIVDKNKQWIDPAGGVHDGDEEDPEATTRKEIDLEKIKEEKS